MYPILDITLRILGSARVTWEEERTYGIGGLRTGGTQSGRQVLIDNTIDLLQRGIYLTHIHIFPHVYTPIACQQGGVSDEPPWLRAATRTSNPLVHQQHEAYIKPYLSVYILTDHLKI